MMWKLWEYCWPGDRLLKWGMAQLNRRKLAQLQAGGPEAAFARQQALVQQLKVSPRAVECSAANQQHYQVAPQFFQQVLGPYLKYSCGYWDQADATLEQSERAMLDLYLERGQLENGQRVLDLGCGWGSFSLLAAQLYPQSSFLAVSNASNQREFIQAQARARGLSNLEVVTCDINQLQLPAQHFDRVVSVEMLEHVRNYAQVLGLLRQALKPGGKLLVHVFCHRDYAYPFDTEGGGWMEREFFSGGLMPSLDLFWPFQGELELEERWLVSGLHYQRTALAWLDNLRRNKTPIQQLLRRQDPKTWRKQWLGWQVFFLACAEMFGYAQGSQWCVQHLRWRC